MMGFVDGCGPWAVHQLLQYPQWHWLCWMIYGLMFIEFHWYIGKYEEWNVLRSTICKGSITKSLSIQWMDVIVLFLGTFLLHSRWFAIKCIACAFFLVGYQLLLSLDSDLRTLSSPFGFVMFYNLPLPNMARFLPPQPPVLISLV